MTADPVLRAAEELSGSFLEQGRRDEAAAALRAALRRSPDWTRGRLSLARILLSLGRFDEAGEALAGAAPGGETSLLSARVEAHAGRRREAEALLRRAAAELPGDPEPSFRLAELLQRRGRDDEAIALLAALPPLDGPGTPRSLADEFKRAFFALDFERAAAAGERLLDVASGPGRADPLRWPSLAEEWDLTWAGRRHHARALAALDALIATRKAAPWTLYYRAVFRRNMAARRWGRGWEKKAAADFAALKRFPAARYGWTRLEAAKERLLARDLRGALEGFRAAAAASEPPHWMALCHAGELLACLGKPEDAMKELARAVEAAPPPSKGDALAWRGEVLSWLGRWEEALPALRDGASRGAQYAHGWTGGALLKLGRAEEALPHLDRALAVSPEDAESRCWRAECLLALGRAKEAKAEAEAALEKGLDHRAVFPRVLRGLARLALGDRAGARADAAALRPRVAAEVRRRLKLKDGDFEGVLRGVLTLSRGARREGYPMRMWLGFVPETR